MRYLLITLFTAMLSFSAAVVNAERISIEARVGNNDWVILSAIEPLRGQTVSLRVKQIPGAKVRWFQIVPNIDIRYNNAVWPWLPNAYKWKGFDQIKYSRIPLNQLDGKWQVELFSEELNTIEESDIATKNDSLFSYIKKRLFRSGDPENSFHNKILGSFWYQAEVTHGNRTYATPGIKDKDKRGLSPGVFRVSVKQGNDLIGNLTSYFNVPAVFGSTPYQVKNHIGIDCADVLMAAYSKSRRLPIEKDYNVAMLTSKFQILVKAQIENGRPQSIIRWGQDIRAGDFIAVKYPGARQYQHIGALYKDQNGNDVLDEEDLVLHAGPDPLHWSDLGSGVFDGTVVILRPM